MSRMGPNSGSLCRKSHKVGMLGGISVHAGDSGRVIGYDNVHAMKRDVDELERYGIVENEMAATIECGDPRCRGDVSGRSHPAWANAEATARSGAWRRVTR